MSTRPPPSKPPKWVVSTIEDVRASGSVDLSGYPASTNITGVQVGFGTSPSDVTSTQNIGTTGYGWVTNLSRGVYYYIRVRVQNPVGWSAWSDPVGFRTHDFPAKPSRPILSDPRQTSTTVFYTSNGDGGSPALEWQVSWSESASGVGQNPRQYTANMRLDNLPLAKTIYVWGRGRNKYGWGPWTDQASILLVAGVWIKHNNQWRRAIPYVRKDGVWRPAEPYSKLAGLWTRSVS